MLLLNVWQIKLEVVTIWEVGGRGFGKLRCLFMLMHAHLCMYVHVRICVSVHLVVCLCMCVLVYLCILHSCELRGDLQICAMWECCDFGKVTFTLASGCFMVQCTYLIMVIRGRQRCGPSC